MRTHLKQALLCTASAFCNLKQHAEFMYEKWLTAFMSVFFFSFFLSLSLIKITVITVHFCCTNYLPIWLCFVSTCLKLLLYLLLQICDILTKYTNLLENILKNWNICARFTNNKNVLQSITVAHLNVKCFFWHAFIYFDFVLYLNKCTSIWHQSFQNNVLHKDETWKFTH